MFSVAVHGRAGGAEYGVFVDGLLQKVNYDEMEVVDASVAPT
jgi:hypothetical protein